MFVFEVATRYGNIRVVGPAALLQAEADSKAETVARLLRILAVDPDEWVGISIDETDILPGADSEAGDVT